MKLALASMVAIALSLSATASAQSSEDQQARALFDAGRTAYEAGRFEQALRYFRESYDLSHRPALLFNIASAADRLLRAEEAIEAYEAYLAAVPDADNRELAQARIEFLRGVIRDRGETRVATPEEAAQTVAGDPSQPADSPPSSGGGDVTGEWWFWTLIAVLVVGAGAGITAGVVVAASGTQPPLEGDVPVVFALEGR